MDDEDCRGWKLICEQIMFCRQLNAEMSCNQLTLIDSAMYMLIKIMLPNVTAMSFYNTSTICGKQNTAVYILLNNVDSIAVIHTGLVLV